MKPILVIPAKDGRFRIYFDGEPGANAWDTLHRVIDQVARTKRYSISIAGVELGCDSEEELEKLREHLVSRLAMKQGVLPEEGSP